jgi:hypothetical protein
VAAGVLAGWTAFATGLIVSPAIAVAAGAGALLTATRTARPLTKITDIGLPPEAVVPRIVFRVFAPVLPPAAAIVPVLAHHSTGIAASAYVLPGLAWSIGLIAIVVSRARLERRLARVLAGATRLLPH